jgi:hypothetical protein
MENWIKADEFMPPKDPICPGETVTVLGWDGDCIKLVYYYDNEDCGDKGWRETQLYGESDLHITHWIPLPTPPDGQTDV